MRKERDVKGMNYKGNEGDRKEQGEERGNRGGWMRPGKETMGREEGREWGTMQGRRKERKGEEGREARSEMIPRDVDMKVDNGGRV